MTEIDRAAWLGAIFEHYACAVTTPFMVASEILLDRTDADTVALSIARRARKVGNDMLAATTAADVTDALTELVAAGFLSDVFAASCGHTNHEGLGCSEHVLELRLPSHG